MNSSLSSHLSSETTVSRVALWDNAKFLMIVLMTIGHFADVFTGISDSCKSIYLCIYAFHMPCSFLSLASFIVIKIAFVKWFIIFLVDLH